jgi:hypothetical protein
VHQLRRLTNIGTIIPSLYLNAVGSTLEFLDDLRNPNPQPPDCPRESSRQFAELHDRPRRLGAGTYRLAIGSHSFSAGTYSLRASDQAPSARTESLQRDFSTFRAVTKSLAIAAETLGTGSATLRAGPHTFQVCLGTLRIVG